MKYRLTIAGCDDVTSIEVDLNGSEIALLKELAEKFNAASEYGCMPTLEIESAE
jgi:hypothetical protein